MSLPRLVADTNVYAHLASGRLLTAREVEVLVTGATRGIATFWATELSMHEIAFQASTGSEGYVRAQEQFRWMERLCGDRMAPPVHVVLWNAVREPRLEAPARRADVWLAERRAMMQLPETIFRPAAALDHPRELMEREKSDWTLAMQEMRSLLLDAARAGKDLDTTMIAGLLAAWKTATRHDYPKAFTLRPDHEIVHTLRESVHWHVKLSRLLGEDRPSAYNPASKKNAGAAGDRWQLVYPAAGFTLVTSDDGIGRWLRDTGCPDPRVWSLREAIEQIEKAF